MRVMFNAQERTLRELTALTLTAGWKVVRVTRAEGTLFGHVMAVPVEIPSESLRLLEPNSIEGEGSCATGRGKSLFLSSPVIIEVVENIAIHHSQEWETGLLKTNYAVQQWEIPSSPALIYLQKTRLSVRV